MRSAKRPSQTPAAAPPEPSSTDLLFVYGTLMRGFPLHHVLAGGTACVGAGWIQGRLVDLGAYPAAVSDAGARVHGELYRVTRAALWRVLDYAEGPQYDRRQTTVRLDGGGAASAFVYWYRGPLDRSVPITGGDYRTHAPARSIH